MYSRAKGLEIAVTLIEHKLWKRGVWMSEVALIPTVVPDKLRTSAAGFYAGSVAVDIIIGSLPSIAKVCRQERYTNQVEFCIWIINCSWDLMNMRHMCIVYQLKANCPGITLL